VAVFSHPGKFGSYRLNGLSIESTSVMNDIWQT